MALVWPNVRLLGLVFVFLFSSLILFILHDDSPASLESLEPGKNSSSGALPSWQNISLADKNAYQLDPAPNEPPYGAVVAAGQNTTDLSWMIFFERNWTTFPYDVDNPDNPDPRLRIPKSKGHEAMVYLSFIIDNYESLPWCAIFVHGHRDAWHQEDTVVRMLNDLRRPALARAGYISLRCDWFPSCPAEIRPKHHDAVVWGPGVLRKESEAAIAGNWRQLFPGEKMPETIASQCCAQFAVTRQAILKRPRSDYERLRKWLLNTLLEDDVSGRVLEKLWAYLFTGEAVHCPAPQKCACQYFGRCDEQKWTQPPEGLPGLPKWP